jgi:hypothetical protein
MMSVDLLVSVLLSTCCYRPAAVACCCLLRVTKRREAAPGVSGTASRTSLIYRVSRCAVCALQRGQCFFISSRSGLLRRFFLVM